MTTLLPCPFCGGSASWLPGLDEVRCDVCMARLEVEEGFDEWNRRAPPVAIAHEAVDLLREIEQWAIARCPCENEKPDPCTLCGERVEGGICRSVEKSFPPDLYRRFSAFLATPTASDRPVVRPVVDEIAAERQRQIDVEGWTPEHDDAEHGNRQLALAAACFCLIEQAPGYVDKLWPWDIFKDRGPRRNLIRAGALIVAEIERLDRAAPASVPDWLVSRFVQGLESRCPSCRSSSVIETRTDDQVGRVTTTKFVYRCDACGYCPAPT